MHFTASSSSSVCFLHTFSLFPLEAETSESLFRPVAHLPLRVLSISLSCCHRLLPACDQSFPLAILSLIHLMKTA